MKMRRTTRKKEKRRKGTDPLHLIGKSQFSEASISRIRSDLLSKFPKLVFRSQLIDLSWTITLLLRLVFMAFIVLPLCHICLDFSAGYHCVPAATVSANLSLHCLQFPLIACFFFVQGRENRREEMTSRSNKTKRRTRIVDGKKDEGHARPRRYSSLFLPFLTQRWKRKKMKTHFFDGTTWQELQHERKKKTKKANSWT